jgi:hypothetical protein
MDPVMEDPAMNIDILDDSGKYIGFIRATAGGFYRASRITGISIGPFWTDGSAARWVRGETTTDDRTADLRFQAELSAAVRATGSGCTGVTAIDGHSHYMNGTCDDEVPYSQGGPA